MRLTNLFLFTLLVGLPVDAAPSTSPFAGSYRDGLWSSAWSITISKSGSVRGDGSCCGGAEGTGWSGTFRGDVLDDGSMVCRGTEVATDVNGHAVRTKFEFHATVSLDANGNLVGEIDDGPSWLPLSPTILWWRVS